MMRDGTASFHHAVIHLPGAKAVRQAIARGRKPASAGEQVKPFSFKPEKHEHVLQTQFHIRKLQENLITSFSALVPVADVITYPLLLISMM